VVDEGPTVPEKPSTMCRQGLQKKTESLEQKAELLLRVSAAMVSCRQSFSLVMPQKTKQPRVSTLRASLGHPAL